MWLEEAIKLDVFNKIAKLNENGLKKSYFYKNNIKILYF